MTPRKTLSGRAAVLLQGDIDTDAILPKQFLRRIDREGFGELLFFEWRKDPAFVLNQPAAQGARILITGANFGCGSSREHAVWALRGCGFEAVIAPSFGDIFASNASKNGLMLVAVPDATVQALARRVEANPALEITVDVERCEVRAEGVSEKFALPNRVRRLFLEGLDEIGLTLADDALITAYEQRRPGWMPSIPKR
ncbi:MAG: 3-isopropylmalate dehydratase small subunit [Betaproteobacteria bacterium]